MPKEKVARFDKQYFVVGLRETFEALKKNQVTPLIIAEDVEIYLMVRVLSQINQKSIPISFFKSRHALGKHVGISVSAAIVVLIK